MTAAQQKYILKEALVGAVIGALFSLGFVLAIFGGQTAVPLWGTKGLVLDAIPHTFMIVLPSTLIPTLMTRRRIRRSIIEPVLSDHRPRLNNALARSVVVAVISTAIGVGLHALILPSLTPTTWPLTWTVVFKTAYGCLSGLIASRLAVQTALRDGAASHDPLGAS